MSEKFRFDQTFGNRRTVDGDKWLFGAIAGKMNTFGKVYAYAGDLADKLRAYAGKIASCSLDDMKAVEDCIGEILKDVPKMLENCHRRI